MEVVDISIKLHKNSECIYKETVDIDEKNLNSLLKSLKHAKRKTNEGLTKIVQAEQGPNQEENLTDLDDDSDGDYTAADQAECSKAKKSKDE